MTEVDLAFVNRLVERLGRKPEVVIPMLQALQEHYRYLPQPALERLAEISDIIPAAIAGVSTFFDQFRHRPMGLHLIRVCHGTACHVKGSILIREALLNHLGIPVSG